ncbi:MAG: hypothetical protein ACJ72J_01435, partial [Nitrososphaeraceae archaeon]
MIKVVLSTASIERATIFDILIANKGSLTTSRITTSLNITPHTAHRTMTELSALGLVDIRRVTDETNAEKKITLKSEFSWFLSEEFLNLREAFDPENDNNLEQQPHKRKAETEHEEKDPLTSQKNEDVAATKDYTGESEEKSPPSNTNLASNNQQFEENPTSEPGHEEKDPLTTTNNDNSSLPNNNTSDLNTGLEP